MSLKDKFSPHSKKSTREQEEEAGLQTTNAAGELTAEQTSEQMQKGNATFDNQNAGPGMTPEQLAEKKEKGLPDSGEVVTADKMKGTVTDPVSYSNPAYDPSIDAAKVGAKGEDLDKEDLLHVFKPGHFYKKGDTVRYHGVIFEALQDGHGDIPPNMWKPSSKSE